jgi:hypothetical protein
MRLETGEASPNMLKKIRTTDLEVRMSFDASRQLEMTYEAARVRTPYALGTRVLVSMSRRTGYLLSYRARSKHTDTISQSVPEAISTTHLGIKGVDLTRDKLVSLLGVWVVEQVLFELLGLSGHLKDAGSAHAQFIPR